MFSEHWRSRLFSVWLALVAVLMVLVLPLPARAETPVARVTLYEVNEALRLKADRHHVGAQQRGLRQPALQLGRVVVAHGLQARSEEHTSELQSLTNLVC